MSFVPSDQINSRLSLYNGDITQLKVDAIVNAANKILHIGSGVDRAIYKSAGPQLLDECSKLGGYKVGQAKITPGFNLLAKYVIFTVGPDNGDPELLANCYKSCLEIVKEKGFKSVAFPCISTGFYGFPNEDAAHIAYCSVRKFLEKELDVNIILVQFTETDFEIYIFQKNNNTHLIYI